MSHKFTSRRPQRRGLAGFCAALAITVLLLAPPAHAEPDDDKKGTQAEEPQVLLSVPEGSPVAMRDFLKAIANLLELQLTWDPDDKMVRSSNIVGPLTIRATQSKALERVRAMLTFYDLIMIPIGPKADRHYIVTDARRTSSIMRLKPEFVDLDDSNLERYGALDGLYITTTIRMKHLIDMRNARTALSRIVTGQQIGNVTEVPDARAFVVTDFAPNVVAIYRLLKMIDKEPPVVEAANDARVYKPVTLRHVNAVEIAPKLTELFPPAVVQGPPTSSRRSPNYGQVTTARVPLRILAHARTNQILMTGTAGDIEKVVAAIQTLDLPTTPMTTQVEIVRLEHLDANITARVLSGLVNRSRSHWDANAKAAPPAIESDPQTNSLLIAASEDALASLRKLIKEMDVPQDKAGKSEADDK